MQNDGKEREKKAKRSVSETAQRLLGFREHSAVELRRKLLQKGYEKTEIQDCLDQLSEEGFLSEDRFVEEKIRSLISKNYGPRHIQMNMEQHGHRLSRGEVLEHYEKLDMSPQKQIEGFVRGKKSTDTEKLKAKLYSRGFSVEEINSSVRELDLDL